MVLASRYALESVIVNSIVFAPVGEYSVAPLGLILTSRLSWIADEVRPSVYESELIKDSEYYCPSDSIDLL